MQDGDDGVLQTIALLVNNNTSHGEAGLGDTQGEIDHLISIESNSLGLGSGGTIGGVDLVSASTQSQSVSTVIIHGHGGLDVILVGVVDDSVTSGRTVRVGDSTGQSVRQRHLNSDLRIGIDGNRLVSGLSQIRGRHGVGAGDQHGGEAAVVVGGANEHHSTGLIGDSHIGIRQLGVVAGANNGAGQVVPGDGQVRHGSVQSDRQVRVLI